MASYYELDPFVLFDLVHKAHDIEILGQLCRLRYCSLDLPGLPGVAWLGRPAWPRKSRLATARSFVFPRSVQHSYGEVRA